MPQLKVEFSAEEVARLTRRANRENKTPEQIVREAIRPLLEDVDPFPIHHSRVIVPPGFDWTKNSSWQDLMDEEGFDGS